jgi:hypothetical protein
MKAIIKTPTPDLQKSIDFYKSLNYKVLKNESQVLVTDGTLIIEIDPDRYARAGITFYKNDWSKEIQQLETSFSILPTDDASTTVSPCGVTVVLKTLEKYPAIKLPEKVNVVPGNSSGLSLESFYFENSLNFWSILGYNITMGTKEGGWIAMSNDTDVGIGLMKYKMCPHLFYNPSFTFFNSGKNPEIIHKIREIGIPITEEITFFNKEGNVDNIIIRDPGGFGFFIFND